MGHVRKDKLAMMAATSLIAASAAFLPAHGADYDKVAFPSVVEAPIIPDGGQADQSMALNKKNLAITVVLAGFIAGLLKLIGLKRVARAVQTTAEKTVEVTGKAVGGAAKSIGRIVRSPLRFATLVGALSFFALSGFGFYGVEWLGGIVVGATMMGILTYSAVKLRAVLAPRRAKTTSRYMVNEN